MPGRVPGLRYRGKYRLRLDPAGWRKRRQGEILHLALSFVRSRADISRLEEFLRRALALLGERAEIWPLEELRGVLQKIDVSIMSFMNLVVAIDLFVLM
jgi:hypothetical protein